MSIAVLGLPRVLGDGFSKLLCPLWSLGCHGFWAMGSLSCCVHCGPWVATGFGRWVLQAVVSIVVLGLPRVLGDGFSKLLCPLWSLGCHGFWAMGSLSCCVHCGPWVATGFGRWVL